MKSKTYLNKRMEIAESSPAQITNVSTHFNFNVRNVHKDNEISPRYDYMGLYKHVGFCLNIDEAPMAFRNGMNLGWKSIGSGKKRRKIIDASSENSANTYILNAQTLNYYLALYCSQYDTGNEYTLPPIESIVKFINPIGVCVTAPSGRPLINVDEFLDIETTSLASNKSISDRVSETRVFCISGPVEIYDAFTSGMKYQQVLKGTPLFYILVADHVNTLRLSFFPTTLGKKKVVRFTKKRVRWMVRPYCGETPNPYLLTTTVYKDEYVLDSEKEELYIGPKTIMEPGPYCIKTRDIFETKYNDLQERARIAEAEWRRRLARAERRIDLLEEENRQDQILIDDLRDQINRLEQERDFLLQRIRDLENDNARLVELEEQVREKDELIEELRRRLADLDARIMGGIDPAVHQRLLDQLDELREQMRELQESKNQVTTTLANVRRKLEMDEGDDTKDIDSLLDTLLKKGIDKEQMASMEQQINEYIAQLAKRTKDSANKIRLRKPEQTSIWAEQLTDLVVGTIKDLNRKKKLPDIENKLRKIEEQLNQIPALIQKMPEGPSMVPLMYDIIQRLEPVLVRKEGLDLLKESVLKFKEALANAKFKVPVEIERAIEDIERADPQDSIEATAKIYMSAQKIENSLKAIEVEKHIDGIFAKYIQLQNRIVRYEFSNADNMTEFTTKWANLYKFLSSDTTTHPIFDGKDAYLCGMFSIYDADPTNRVPERRQQLPDRYKKELFPYTLQSMSPEIFNQVMEYTESQQQQQQEDITSIPNMDYTGELYDHLESEQTNPISDKYKRLEYPTSNPVGYGCTLVEICRMTNRPMIQYCEFANMYSYMRDDKVQMSARSDADYWNMIFDFGEDLRTVYNDSVVLPDKLFEDTQNKRVSRAANVIFENRCEDIREWLIKLYPDAKLNGVRIQDWVKKNISTRNKWLVDMYLNNQESLNFYTMGLSFKYIAKSMALITIKDGVKYGEYANKFNEALKELIKLGGDDKLTTMDQHRQNIENRMNMGTLLDPSLSKYLFAYIITKKAAVNAVISLHRYYVDALDLAKDAKIRPEFQNLDPATASTHVLLDSKNPQMISAKVESIVHHNVSNREYKLVENSKKIASYVGYYWKIGMVAKEPVHYDSLNRRLTHTVTNQDDIVDIEQAPSLSIMIDPAGKKMNTTFPSYIYI